MDYYCWLWTEDRIFWLCCFSRTPQFWCTKRQTHTHILWRKHRLISSLSMSTTTATNFSVVVFHFCTLYNHRHHHHHHLAKIKRRWTVCLTNWILKARSLKHCHWKQQLSLTVNHCLHLFSQVSPSFSRCLCLLLQFTPPLCDNFLGEITFCPSFAETFLDFLANSGAAASVLTFLVNLICVVCALICSCNPLRDERFWALFSSKLVLALN